MLIYSVKYFYTIVAVLFQYDGDNSSSGADYFKGSLFGYTVYGMFGLFLIALAVGLFWQYYPRTRKEHSLQTSPPGKDRKTQNFTSTDNVCLIHPPPPRIELPSKDRTSRSEGVGDIPGWSRKPDRVSIILLYFRPKLRT